MLHWFAKRQWSVGSNDRNKAEKTPRTIFVRKLFSSSSRKKLQYW